TVRRRRRGQGGIARGWQGSIDQPKRLACRQFGDLQGIQLGNAERAVIDEHDGVLWRSSSLETNETLAYGICVIGASWYCVAGATAPGASTFSATTTCWTCERSVAVQLGASGSQSVV